MMKYGALENWQTLSKPGYFELLKDGRLKLIVDKFGDLIDFHTHHGWTFLLAPAPNLMSKSSEVKHNFDQSIPVDAGNSRRGTLNTEAKHGH